MSSEGRLQLAGISAVVFGGKLAQTLSSNPPHRCKIALLVSEGVLDVNALCCAFPKKG